jgi:hypothetical protein
MKNGTKGYAVLGILFVLISVIVFVIPGAKTAPFWIAYGFTAAAFAAQILIWRAAFGKNSTPKSKFFGLPVVQLGVVYLCVQLVLLALFRFVPGLPVWSAIAVCAVLAGIAAVGMIAADVGRGEVERVEAKAQKKTFYIKEMQTEVELLASAEPDAETKAALSRLAEKIRFSDPMSHEKLAELEDEIAAKTAELRGAGDKQAVIAELNRLWEERNKKIEILK